MPTHTHALTPFARTHTHTHAQVLAGKLGGRRITVNAIAPGPFEVKGRGRVCCMRSPRSLPLPLKP